MPGPNILQVWGELCAPSDWHGVLGRLVCAASVMEIAGCETRKPLAGAPKHPSVTGFSSTRDEIVAVQLRQPYVVQHSLRMMPIEASKISSANQPTQGPHPQL
jgi:hypothetical protein